jgi:flagellar FliL protein
MIFRYLSLLLAAYLFVLPAYAQDETADGEESATSASRYIDLKPDFVVNYGGVGRLRYLKTSISLRVSGGSAGPSGLRHHMPYVRHALVMRLSRATEEELASMEGRELLRQDVLAVVREVLLGEEGVQHIDDLLFNSFIVQR